jgi:hypothetical protein
VVRIGHVHRIARVGCGIAVARAGGGEGADCAKEPPNTSFQRTLTRGGFGPLNSDR